MGFYVRRSVNFGPLRVNLSKSGLGYSVGGRGFRTGVRADGRRYTRLSVPGTGVGYYASHARPRQGRAPQRQSPAPAAGGCLVYIALLGSALALAALSSPALAGVCPWPPHC
jgi:hypothetical protein